jgi:hypothetical protein
MNPKSISYIKVSRKRIANFPRYNYDYDKSQIVTPMPILLHNPNLLFTAPF